MNAVTPIDIPASEPADQKLYNVLIHLRFSPGCVLQTIGFCPDTLGINDWHQHLRTYASDYYEAYSNGRGLFRLPPAVFDAVVAKVSA